MEHLGRKLATRIIRPTALRGMSSISDIDLSDDSVFIEPKSIFLDGQQKQHSIDCSVKEIYPNISMIVSIQEPTSILRMHDSTFKTNF